MADDGHTRDRTSASEQRRQHRVRRVSGRQDLQPALRAYIIWSSRRVAKFRTCDGHPLLEAAQADGQAAEHLAAPQQVAGQYSPCADRQHPWRITCLDCSRC